MAETDLTRLLAGMAPALDPERYVFVALPPGAPLPTPPTVRMMFREAEGTTLVLPAVEAEAAGLRSTFPCRMITLSIQSALDAVGFMAAVSAALASEGIGVNPVAAYHHDHLFVPADRAEDAMRALIGLQARAAA
jgi:hypothetical protein